MHAVRSGFIGIAIAIALTISGCARVEQPSLPGSNPTTQTTAASASVKHTSGYGIVSKDLLAQLAVYTVKGPDGRTVCLLRTESGKGGQSSVAPISCSDADTITAVINSSMHQPDSISYN